MDVLLKKSHLTENLAEFDRGDLGLLEALTLAGCFPARAPMTKVDRR